jgi:hypothetical protein
VDWINPTGKEGPFIDRPGVQAEEPGDGLGECTCHRGSGGVDGQSLSGFAEQADQHLNRLQGELQGDSYQPQLVQRVQIPKAGKPEEYRTIGTGTKAPTSTSVDGLETVETRNDKISRAPQARRRCAGRRENGGQLRWHLANTPALHTTLSNAYFASLGLPKITARG